ncbi:MAG: response regulator [Kofleriaceae bacterium]
MFKKIVIAEDDDAIAHMVGMALGDAGFLCLRAYDGDEALRLVRAHDPDLLVLDWMMPRVDGIEVARRLKSDVMWSRTPILMLTALTSVEQQVEGLEAGADAYMTKPFDLREFGARAKALIRATKRERDRNPTTDLPGSRAVDEHLAEALKADAPVAVLHVDVRGFDAYADAVGFAAAEQAVRALAKVVLELARQHGDGGAFVGHLGGSDFIVVVGHDRGEPLAHALIERLTADRAKLFTGDATKLDAVIAVAPTTGVPVGGTDQMAKRLGAAMRTAKQAPAAGYVTWRG